MNNFDFQLLKNIPCYKTDYLVAIPTIIINYNNGKTISNNICLYNRWTHFDIVLKFLK